MTTGKKTKKPGGASEGAATSEKEGAPPTAQGALDVKGTKGAKEAKEAKAPKPKSAGKPSAAKKAAATAKPKEPAKAKGKSPASKKSAVSDDDDDVAADLGDEEEFDIDNLESEPEEDEAPAKKAGAKSKAAGKRAATDDDDLPGVDGEDDDLDEDDDDEDDDEDDEEEDEKAEASPKAPAAATAAKPKPAAAKRSPGDEPEPPAVVPARRLTPEARAKLNELLTKGVGLNEALRQVAQWETFVAPVREAAPLPDRMRPAHRPAEKERETTIDDVDAPAFSEEETEDVAE